MGRDHAGWYGVVRSEFRTTDRESAERFIREMYSENTLDLRPNDDRFTLDHRQVSAPGFAVNTLCIGIDHRVGDVDLGSEDHLLVIQPVRGRTAFYDAAYPDTGADSGGVLLAPPTGRTRAVCERLEAIMVPLDRDRVADHAAAATGIDAPDLAFDGLAPLSPGLGRHWAKTVTYVRDVVLADPWAAEHPLLLDQAFRTLAATLLSTFPNTALARAVDPAAPPVRGRVPGPVLDEVVDYLDAHAHRPVGPAEIAGVARDPVAAIVEGLRRRGRHPAALLWHARLRGLRRDLLDADPGSGTTVAELAARWGFSRGGRFRLAYDRAFDESPEDTLRR